MSGVGGEGRVGAELVSRALRWLGGFALCWLVAGCGSGGSFVDSRSGAGEVARVAASTTLFVEPNAHRSPVLSLIRAARRSIRLEVYLLTDRSVIAELAHARRRGVDVRAILEQNPYGARRYAQLAYDALRQAGVPVRWANERAFTYTHEKAIEIDGQTAGIFTFNFTSSGLLYNREFGMIDPSRSDAAALAAIFDADWNRRPAAVHDPRLVVSPSDSRRDVENLIDGARTSLIIYAEEVADAGIEGKLAAAVRRGVRVRLITSQSNPGVLAVERWGVRVELMLKPYVHAKAIVADGRRLFIGSENLSTTSLDKNREVGIMLDDASLAATVTRTFTADWSGAHAATSTSTPTPRSTAMTGALHVRVSVSPRSVSRNEELAIAITTTPGALCRVKVTYPNGYVSQAHSLSRGRRVGSPGVVWWRLRIGTRSIGTGHARGSCTLGTATSSGTATFRVT